VRGVRNERSYLHERVFSNIVFLSKLVAILNEKHLKRRARDWATHTNKYVYTDICLKYSIYSSETQILQD
jgi:hypothetical protein